jgi:hypothetical protein
VKVAGRLQRLFEQGFDRVARSRFVKGENPFTPTGAKHLHLAGELLLRGGLTRTSFRQACVARLGWSAATASAESSQALALLRLLGLTQERGEQITIAMTTT